MTNILILGAGSAIARATAQRYAAQGARLFLVARDPQRLDTIAADLRVRGATQVDVLAADLTEHERHPAIVAAADDAMNGIDTVLIAHGVLPDQEACEADARAALAAIDINFVSVVSLCTELANLMAERQAGTIAVISSVAGDRGRQSNYIYGAAKGGLNTFLQGLRNRLQHAGVHVLTIKPGFVATPMTEHLPDRSGPLWAQPDDIAEGIVRAIEKGRDEVYLPWFWAVILMIIKLLPEALFKRLKL
ncbi:MAG: SDR family oxidoreductase [Gammaproteobacteria bacterium]|nr:SDR family oxidoreductase [Gammaproteobacteria bacterium]